MYSLKSHGCRRRRSFPLLFAFILAISFFILPEARAYVGNTGRLGTLAVSLEKPPKIEALDRAVEVATILKNDGGEAVEARLDFATIDTLEFPESGADAKRSLRKAIRVPGHETVSVKVKVLARSGTYNAHYPISLDVTAAVDGKERSIHVVHPVQTEVGPNPKWPKNTGYPDAVATPWPKPDAQDQARSNEWDRKIDAIVADESKTADSGLHVFQLGSGRRGVVALGKYGLLDGKIALVERSGKTVFNGIRVWILGKPMTEFISKPLQSTGENAWEQEIDLEGRKAKILFTVKQDREVVRLSVDSAEPGLLTHLEFGPTNVEADRVYFGHGYVVEKPGAFRVGAGGHHLSTSHVGFDFENGISVLMATTTPPTSILVDPATKTYTLTTRPGTTFTLFSGDRNRGGALGCAVRFRDYTDKRPAPGVATKSGRFVVDIWNGLYTEHAALIRRAAEYGLKNDLMFISHNWQRYRYDHRLPDIWPPNPLFGTTTEMKEAMRTAYDNGWLFGVHMNYIDYYPDSSAFTFDDVTFTRSGDPRKAYLNVMLHAQSYQCRPNRAADVFKRTTTEMFREFPMSCAFVDVFASTAPTEFYDRNGNYYPRTDAIAGWGELFQVLRDRMNAPSEADETLVGRRPAGEGIVYPTVSEAGNDFLVGRLDGADCQFMYLTNVGGENRWLRIAKYADWERVPWFDAVHHTNFSLHGVGYSIRYEGGRGRELHGIDSDDYICSEIQLGHDLMVDGACRDVKEVLEGTVRKMDVDEALRAAVRKYRLAQPVAENLAGAEIESVEFVDGNIHRQRIRWSNGTVVTVNRGTEDWNVDGMLLPQYGFRAKNDSAGLNATVCRLGGKVVERTFSRKGDRISRFFNARGTTLSGLVAATPRVEGFQALAEGQFRLPIHWNVRAQLPVEDYRLTLHLVRRKSTEASSGEDAVIGAVFPDNPISSWAVGKQTSVTRRNADPSSDETLVVPESFPSGTYDLLISADSPNAPNDVHRRGRLFATPSFWRRYHLGQLTVHRDPESKKIARIAFQVADDEDASLYDRLLPPKEPIHFGSCRTTGGVYCEVDAGGKRLLVMPLPGEKTMTIELSIGDFFSDTVRSVRAEVLDASGNAVKPLDVELKAGKLVFAAQQGDHAYSIVADPE